MAEPQKQNFLHGATILTAGVVIIKILGAIYKIPLQNILGDTGFGYFNAAYIIYNVLLTIATAGLPVALSRMISETNTLGRPNQAKRIYRVALITLSVLGAIGSALMFFFPTEMAILFVSKPEISQCVYALSPSVLLVCITSAYRGYIQGYGNMKPTTVGQVFEVLVKVIVGLALAIVLTRSGKSLPISSAGAIFGVTAGSLAAMLYMIWCYVRRYKVTAVKGEDEPDSVGSTLANFLKIGVVITVGASVMSVITLIDTKLIQIQLPNVEGIGPALADELYGSYAAMQTLYNLPAAFITPMTIAVVPAISAAVARHEHQEACNIAESSLRISSVLAMPMGVGLAVLSYPIVHVLYPNTNENGPLILIYLAVASIFVCIALVTNSILQASGNERIPILSMIVGGVVKIGANLLLVGRPAINIFGAPIGTIFCYAVICLINCFFISKKQRVKPKYAKVFLPALVSSVVMGGAAWAVYGLAGRILPVQQAASRMPTILAMGVAIVVAVVLYLVLILVTRAVTAEDLKLIPGGKKLIRLLHIR